MHRVGFYYKIVFVVFNTFFCVYLTRVIWNIKHNVTFLSRFPL